ncbi:MAG TPA: PAS domain S-box protein [bacterium]|nr:PAS domain S-box protein [bacterium]
MKIKIKESIYSDFFPWFNAALISIACIIFGIFYTTIVVNTTKNNVKKELSIQVNTAAAALHPEYIGSEKLLDMHSLEYTTTLEQLRRVTAANPNVHWYYMMAKQGENIIWTVDPDTTSEQTPAGEIWDNPTEDVWEIFETGESSVTGPVTDEWGTWVSAMAAIKNAQGEIVGVLGLDVEAKDWYTQINAQIRRACSISFLVWVILELSLVAYFVRLKYIKHIRALNADLQRELEDRKDIEEMLWEAENRFKDITQSCGDWCWEIDNTGKYTYVLGNCQEALGYTAKEMVGKNVTDFFPAEQADQLTAELKDGLERHAPIKDWKNAKKTKDGRTITVVSNGVPMIDQDGCVVGYRGVSRVILTKK